MDQDKQTLLQAAKMVLAIFGGYTNECIADLRAAIAREEAKPSGDSAYWEALCDTRKVAMEKAMDRAQQAESTAAWHRSESERLSAELALARNQLTLAVDRSERLSEQLAGCHYDLGEANKQRQRAEKAEAELDKVRHDNQVSLLGVRSDLKSFAQTSMDALNLLLKALGGKS